MHYFRYLSPSETQFYGLRPSARFISSRKIVFKINNHKLTIPKGFIADGLDFDVDFTQKPSWMAWEYVYCTHQYDYKEANR